MGMLSELIDLTSARRKYPDRVKWAAREVIGRIAEGETDLHDAVHRQVDDDQLVIYTHEAKLVALVSNSDGAGLAADAGIEHPTYEQIAYFALEADVMACLEDVAKKWLSATARTYEEAERVREVLAAAGFSFSHSIADPDEEAPAT